MKIKFKQHEYYLTFWARSAYDVPFIQTRSVISTSVGRAIKTLPPNSKMIRVKRMPHHKHL